jgi:hypothetical protein
MAARTPGGGNGTAHWVSFDSVSFFDCLSVS